MKAFSISFHNLRIVQYVSYLQLKFFLGYFKQILTLQAHRLLRENQLAWKKEGTKIRRKQRRALKASKRRHEMGMVWF